MYVRLQDMDSNCTASAAAQIMQDYDIDHSGGLVSLDKFYSDHSHARVLSSQVDDASRGMNGSFLHVAIAPLWPRDGTRVTNPRP